MPFRFFGPDTLPDPFDVVWCRFPYIEHPDQPADVPHPCLIRQTLLDSKGRPWVDVVYGTSKAQREGPQYHDISEEAQRACGLNRPTRFDWSRQERVPWSEEYFETRSGVPPTTHPLPPDEVRAVQETAAYYENQRASE